MVRPVARAVALAASVAALRTAIVAAVYDMVGIAQPAAGADARQSATVNLASAADGICWRVILAQLIPAILAFMALVLFCLTDNDVGMAHG